jgi:hypothetical protein
MELVTELSGESKYKLIKVEKDLHPGYEIQTEN